MTSLTHSKQMDALRVLLNNLGHTATASFLGGVIDIALASDAKSMTSVLKALKKINPANDRERPSLLLHELRAIEVFSRQTYTVPFNKFYSAFVKQIERLSSMSNESILSKLKEILRSSSSVEQGDVPSMSTVADYIAALENSVNDAEAFPLVFASLKSDRAMQKKQVIEIASVFAFPMSSSTTKRKALECIWHQFETSKTLAAKIRAQAGKSAA